jgi:hypothetical protein
MHLPVIASKFLVRSTSIKLIDSTTVLATLLALASAAPQPIDLDARQPPTTIIDCGTKDMTEDCKEAPHSYHCFGMVPLAKVEYSKFSAKCQKACKCICYSPTGQLCA